MALACLALLFLPITQAFSQSQATEYLCERGKVAYEQGKTDEALGDFNKVLEIDPDNQFAKKYVNLIFQEVKQPVSAYIDQEKTDIVSASPQAPIALSKDAAMDMAMSDLEGSNQTKNTDGFTDAAQIDPLDKDKPRGFLIGGLRVTGEMLLSAGVASPDDFIWKRANYDMNERNWRMLSETAYNNRFNTFDARVYDSLSVNLDTENPSGFNFHTNITVDPWSFTGKSEKTNLTSAFGDSVGVELRYWSNTGYTREGTLYSDRFGNTFLTPELKVQNNMTDPFVTTGGFWPADSLSVPALKIKRTFQPVREFWFDYINPDAGIKFRAFPIAYQDQAFSSDDPLNITNHHKWWAASSWLKRYTPGRYNPFGADYTKGVWDDAYSTVRDSNGRYLTALRGFSFELGSAEETLFSTTVATPKDLWQPYEEVDNYITASRLKHYVKDNFSLGATFTSRTGLDVDNKNRTDSRNYVGGADLSYEFIEGLKAQAEVLASQSYYDQTSSQYGTKGRGNAYYFTIINRYPQKELISLADAYNASKKDKEESFMMKSKFFLARMDESFDSSLSNYRYTRDDDYWSRHISFRRPFGYFSPGLSSAYVDQGGLDATRLGDGIDKGRSVIGFRVENFYENIFSNLFDLRNVHKTDGKYVETVLRDEMTFRPIEKLTLKGLLLYQNLPKTQGGFDSFSFDSDTDIGLINDAVSDGADPSIKTGSLGIEYAFQEWIKANLVWERTNDYYLAYGNFPNGMFNSANLGRIYSENGNTYRGWIRWLYSQGIFEQAPYPFYNIYKAGIDFSPMDKMNIYLDYTYNDFKMAGQNSDNMNHIGLQMVYEPTEKMGFCFKYTYSLWKNPVLVNEGSTKTTGHHNFFGEFRYLLSKDDELSLQYGEGNASSIGSLYDPTGGSLLTIDTAHIVRAYYRRKF